MCSAKWHVRFTPNSDRDSGLPQTVMSALPLKADMCSALAHVCFGPKADIARAFLHRVSSSGQETDDADKYQANWPYEVEIEPASREEFQTEPPIDQERNHAAGNHHG